MLDLPWTTVRGLHVLKALARRQGPLRAAELAREAAVTPARLTRLLRLLRVARLVETRRGGWVLTRPADQIRVLEAVDALGAGRARPAHCRADWANCDDRGGCALAPLCRPAQEALQEVFRTRTLADLQPEVPALF